MTREPAEPLRLDYLIKAGTIHSMTGETYRSVGLRGAEIVAVAAEPDGLDDLAGGGTAVVDAGDLRKRAAGLPAGARPAVPRSPRPSRPPS